MNTQLESLWVLALLSKCTHDHTLFSSLLLFLLLLLISLHLLHWSHPGGPAWGRLHHRRCIIPGPRGLPFVGSLPLLSHHLPHHRLATAARQHRATRLMALSLGHIRLVVTSHPDVAKLILHSPAFSDRPLKSSARHLLFHRAIGFAPHGAYWRSLRRITAAHLFSPKQIASSEPHRLIIAACMVRALGPVGPTSNEPVRIREVIKRASLNHMMWSVFGRDGEVGGLSSRCETEEVRGLVEEGYELLGKLDWADHLPWLAGLDLQRTRFRCSKLVPKVNRFVSRVIEEHRNGRTGSYKGKRCMDFVDVLLSLDGPDKLSDPDMVAVLWEMIFRGTDTVAVLIEWVLARMVLHADVQSKVHSELDRVVGKSRSVTESDLTSMVYLPSVIKEVLRLHPPGPLLSWSRLAITDANIDGYDVPAGTTAMVNMWAIARDPQVWAHPLEFKPERFISQDPGAEFSVFGSDLRLAPFGSGRRSCPGKALGFMTATFWVATLLHEYEWEAPDQNPVDLTEVLRLSCEMANPLTVKVRRRRS